jgi:hypothetical protein
MSETKKVLASKESCLGASAALVVLVDTVKPITDEANELVKIIRTFLVAAEKKLPTEAAYDKERTRKQKYKRPTAKA